MASSATTTLVSSMTPAQLLNYNNTRAKLFKGTIVVACVYGAIALTIILCLIFLESAREVLGGTLLYFTVTLILGMIILIILLAVQVSTWMPNSTAPDYGQDSCPDFWDIEAVDQSSATDAYQLAPDNYKPYVRYRCRPRANLFPANTSTIPAAAAPAVYTANTAEGMSAVNDLLLVTKNLNANLTTSSNNPMTCGLVYPEVLAYEDANKYPDNPNATRCQWSRLCGNVPWSSVCGDIPTADVKNTST